MKSGSVRDREFLGQGLAFPLQFNPRGEIALAGGESDIEQSIRIILSTVPGERVMRPEFGCRAWSLLFAPRDATTRSLMVDYVAEALRMWEPRIDLQGIQVSDDPRDDGIWMVDIAYQIKDTHDTRSIVYPFFLAGEEEA